VTPGDVRTLLDAHVPVDAKEEADKAAMLHFLAHLPAPLSAGQQTAHFTASALVLDESRSRTCLVLHRKLGLWLQPGGHVEADDASIADAALREVREETGRDGRLADEAPVHLAVHESPERPEMPAHLHLAVRFVGVAAGDDSLARLIRAAI
jgi:8-oxo-dGTP pyrophosphatase MutT (NUDIX family)